MANVYTELLGPLSGAKCFDVKALLKVAALFWQGGG